LPTFSAPPAGIPFKEFTEQVWRPGDDAEVDALEIYMILIDVKHSTDESKTDTK
jgi:hypothetical protein